MMRVLICLWTVAGCLTLAAAEKKIVLLAGSASHGSGEHEFNAGCNLLLKCLKEVAGVRAEVHVNGWPNDEKVLHDADAIFLYSDGGNGHPFNRPERREVLGKLIKK